MFNLKKNLFLEGKMQSLCSGKYLRTLVFLGLSAAPFQWVSAQFNLSLTNPNLGSVIKEIQAQSDYQFFYDDKLASVQLESLNVTDSSLQEVLSKALSGKNISYKMGVCQNDASSFFTNKAPTFTSQGFVMSKRFCTFRH